MAALSFLGGVVSTGLIMGVVLWQDAATTGITCANVLCPPGKTCQPDSKGQAECVCHTGCPKIYDPVCGSDGKTHSNECLLQAEACKTNTVIKIMHKGDCKASCEGITCPPGKSCEENDSGKAECTCNTMCTMEIDPVCGNNGKTYGNLCLLEVATCQTNGYVTLAHKGECGSGRRK